MSRHRNALLNLVAALAAAVVFTTWYAAPAQAHAVLVDTNPVEGEVVQGSPARILLTFNEPMRAPATISVEGPDGAAVADDPQIDDERVYVDLEPMAADGTYTVSWRAVSADDHPINGEFTFEVTGAGPAGQPTEEPPQDDFDSTEEPVHPDAVDATEEPIPDLEDPGVATEVPEDHHDDDAVAASDEAAGGGMATLPLLLGAAAMAAVLGVLASMWARRRNASRGRPGF